jgi:DNA processing protein
VPPSDQHTLDLLRLTLTPGLGPILIARLLDTFRSPANVLAASPKDLERIRGIGVAKSAAIAKGLKESARLVEPELALCQKHTVRLVPHSSPEYPPLLQTIPDPPPLLYLRGTLRPSDLDRYSVAIVGSRECTAYGVEQAERFAGVLARAGLTIISGGARGIDTAAHRGALRAQGRTAAILGCGLANCYPPENDALFATIAGDDAEPRGAVISELPMRTNPEAENFPARNRLISGMSLGVIVIEAGRRSGSLITARLAAEDHNREVMAVPGRVDSASSWGSHDLIKNGAAALVTDPGDVLQILETPARHSFNGVHEARYADPSRSEEPTPLFDPPGHAEARDAAARSPAAPPMRAALAGLALTDAQRTILDALAQARTLDELSRDTGLDPSRLRAELTILEIQKRVARQGSRLARVI